MHRPKTERQALAQRLLGTATEPGPIDVGWLKARYGIEGSHIKRWREQGILAARIDELEAAVRELAGTTKEPPPKWAAEMREDLLSAIREAGWTAQEKAALRAIDATARPTPEGDDDPPETKPQAPAHGRPRASPRGR